MTAYLRPVVRPEECSVKRSKTNLIRSTSLTAVVGSPRDMWEKLHWNWERYSDELQTSKDGKSVGFAALAYAKTAVALQEWLKATITQPNRSERTDVASLNDDDIRSQGAVHAVANAAKHSRYRDKKLARRFGDDGDHS